MSERDQAHGTRDVDAGTSDRGGAPGKRSLTDRLPVQQRAVDESPRARASAPVVTTAGDDPYGMHLLDRGGAVQRRAGDPAAGDEAVHEAAQHGTRGAGGALPHLDAIQRSFGRHDVRGVKAHTGADAEAGARAMGAEAFATGDHVAFAGAPGLHTAAHEAAHVIQQRGGVALKGGVGEVGDPYERHADQVADLVVRGESAEALLDQMAGGGAAGGGAVQRAAVVTTYGTFKDESYTAVEHDHKKVGADITISFDPAHPANAKKIGLMQSQTSIQNGAARLMHPGDAGKSVTNGNAAGAQHDTRFGDNNPVYGAPRLAAGKGLADTPMSAAPAGEAVALSQNSTYELGYRYQEQANWKTQKARMWDRPQLPGAGNNSSQTFETTALALDGADKDTYYGSVSWGWKIDNDGNFTMLPLTKVSDAKPSENFTEPAKKWNQFTVASKLAAPDAGGNTTTLADVAVKIDGKLVTIAAGSKLNIDKNAAPVGGDMLAVLTEPVQIVDGGVKLWALIDKTKVAAGAMTEDVVCSTVLGNQPFTVTRGSKVTARPGDFGTRGLYEMKQAVLKDVDMMLRIVFIPGVDVNGDTTVPLPIPA